MKEIPLFFLTKRKGYLFKRVPENVVAT